MAGKRTFGTVRKLPSGRWQARYPDSSGRLVPAPDTFTTKGDAHRFLSAVEADQARGVWIDPRAGRLTLSDWAAEWLGRPGKRRNSLARDRQALAKYLPTLGPKSLASLNPSNVRAVVQDAAAAVGPATAARDLAALRAVFNAAVEADLIARSPLRGIKLAPVEPPDRPTLTPDELSALAGAIHPRFRALVLLAGWLGLRWSEAIALRREDVDFLRRTVTVSHTISEVAGRVEDDDAKSRASRRTITMPRFLVDELARHLSEHRPGSGPGDLVFVGRNGAPLRRSFAARHFGPAVERAGLDPAVTFHGLRHVATSFMVDSREHPRVMQTRLGHASSKLTIELYAHVSGDTDRAAADRLDALQSGHDGAQATPGPGERR